MKTLVVRLSLLGVLTGAYVIGLNAASHTANPHLIAYCCTSGDGQWGCCSTVRGCGADQTSCWFN